MPLNLGNRDIKDIYLGAIKIKEAYLGSVKVYGLNQIFYINVIQPVGGIITATPVQGSNGTEVTLSNSPSPNYEFGSYSVIGATLSGNKFTINNSDVTVTGTFNLYQQDWVDMGSTEYYGGHGSIIWTELTGMPSSSTLNYFTIIFDLYLASGYIGAADMNLANNNGNNNNNNGRIWRMRAHNLQPYPGFVGINQCVIDWTTAQGAPTVGSYVQDNVSYRYCSSKFNKNTYARFKIAFDRPNRLGYVYIDNTLLGYATLDIDPISISKFGLRCESGSSDESAMMKNIKVSGFNTLARAQEWN